MKIVLLDAVTLGSVNLEKFSELGEFVTYDTTKIDEIEQRICDAEIILTNKIYIGADELAKAKKLKLICITATGTNNVDLEACATRGIIVKNVVGYSTNSVAQIAFSSILSFISRIEHFDSFVKSGAYARSGVFTYMNEEFSEISGKKFCVVGLGNIGSKVYQIAEAFGCEVCYFSTSGTNIAEGYKQVSFEEVLKCDIISIHCGLNEKTKNLFDEKALSQMKPTAVLANFGRGGIVNEIAVSDAIDTQKIGGYITDVFEVEPLAKTSALLHIKDKERVLFTPHIAWASKESRARLMQSVFENIKSFLA